MNDDVPNKNQQPVSDDFSESLQNLTLQQALEIAMQQHQLGNLSRAATIYQQILQSQPNEPVILHLLGVIASQLRQYEKAEKLIQKAIHIKPDFDEAHNNLANVFKAIGNLDKAVEHYQTAIKLKPDVAQAHYNLAISLEELERLQEAVTHYKKAINIKPDLAEAYNNFASLLVKLGDSDHAITHFNKAIELIPDEAQFYQNLGDLFKSLNQPDEAIKSYRKAIDINPANTQAYRQLSNVEKNSVNEVDIKNMGNLINQTESTDEQKMHLAFALGKSYEDLEQYQQSFEFIIQGNLLRRKSFNFQIKEWVVYIENVIRVFDESLFSQHTDTGCLDNTPLFIFGMPRSGTSLIEQILASHPDVYGAGEMQTMKKIVNHSFNKNEYPVSISQKDNAFFTGLGEKYISIMREINKDFRFVSNKMTGNFIYAGLIKLMLPNAVMIHCQRNPLDTCLSIFKNYFSSEGHHYAYDQTELGLFYNSYQKLMKHWHKVLPGFIYDVQYEDVVNDQKSQTQKLLQHCGLEWDDACLNFHQTKRSVDTASASQVRKPIYTDSIQSWKHYEQQLKPLIDALKIE